MRHSRSAIRIGMVHGGGPTVGIRVVHYGRPTIMVIVTRVRAVMSRAIVASAASRTGGQLGVMHRLFRGRVTTRGTVRGSHVLHWFAGMLHRRHMLLLARAAAMVDRGDMLRTAAPAPTGGWSGSMRIVLHHVVGVALFLSCFLSAAIAPGPVTDKAAARQSTRGKWEICMFIWG